MTLHRSRLFVPVAAFLLLVLSGCEQKSPEEQVADLRSHYTAELNGFIARAQTPEIPEPMDPDENDMADETGSEEPMDDTEMTGDEMDDPEAMIEEEDLPTGPLLSDILLDIVIQHDADENLPGITLDVTQAGPDEQEKNHYRFYVETANIARGQHAQINHTIEGVEYTDGDGFFVEVRHPVPAGERSEYQEFTP